MIEQNTTLNLKDAVATPTEALLSKPIALMQLIIFSAIGLIMFLCHLPSMRKARFCSIMGQLIWSISSIHCL